LEIGGDAPGIDSGLGNIFVFSAVIVKSVGRSVGVGLSDQTVIAVLRIIGDDTIGGYP
jgi:hypothetical protein